MFRLYLIADRDAFANDSSWLEAIAAVAPLVGTSPSVGLQVRIRGRAPADEATLADAALRRIGRARERTLLNAASASANGYAGIHCPEARQELTGVGASVHSLDALRRAEAAGTAFAVFSPVFDPSTKRVRGVGLEALRVVASTARVPVLALGGVTPERVRACLGAGAFGVAVASGVFLAREPMAAARRYMAGLAG
jgi:thiamine monophosphate synthase